MLARAVHGHHMICCPSDVCNILTCKCVDGIAMTTNSRGQEHCNVLKDRSLYLTSLTSHHSSEASMHKVLAYAHQEYDHNAALYTACQYALSEVLLMTVAHYSRVSHYKHCVVHTQERATV
jgi:hypothetical protein